jgi:hypothetical protein
MNRSWGIKKNGGRFECRHPSQENWFILISTVLFPRFILRNRKQRGKSTSSSEYRAYSHFSLLKIQYWFKEGNLWGNESSLSHFEKRPDKIKKNKIWTVPFELAVYLSDAIPLTVLINKKKGGELKRQQDMVIYMSSIKPLEHTNYVTNY